jgi:hypothetical protein
MATHAFTLPQNPSQDGVRYEDQETKDRHTASSAQFALASNHSRNKNAFPQA